MIIIMQTNKRRYGTYLKCESCDLMRSSSHSRTPAIAALSWPHLDMSTFSWLVSKGAIECSPAWSPRQLTSLLHAVHDCLLTATCGMAFSELACDKELDKLWVEGTRAESCWRVDFMTELCGRGKCGATSKLMELGGTSIVTFGSLYLEDNWSLLLRR